MIPALIVLGAILIVTAALGDVIVARLRASRRIVRLLLLISTAAVTFVSLVIVQVVSGQPSNSTATSSSSSIYFGMDPTTFWVLLGGAGLIGLFLGFGAAAARRRGGSYPA